MAKTTCDTKIHTTNSQRKCEWYAWIGVGRMIRIAPSGLQDKSLAANKQRHTLVHVSPHPSRLLSQLHRARISLLSDLRPESRHRAVFALAQGTRRLYAENGRARTRRGVRRGQLASTVQPQGQHARRSPRDTMDRGPFSGESEHSGGSSLLSPDKTSMMRNSSYGREKVETGQVKDHGGPCKPSNWN